MPTGCAAGAVGGAVQRQSRPCFLSITDRAYLRRPHHTHELSRSQRQARFPTLAPRSSRTGIAHPLPRYCYLCLCEGAGPVSIRPTCAQVPGAGPFHYSSEAILTFDPCCALRVACTHCVSSWQRRPRQVVIVNLSRFLVKWLPCPGVATICSAGPEHQVYSQSITFAGSQPWKSGSLEIFCNTTGGGPAIPLALNRFTASWNISG